MKDLSKTVSKFMNHFLRCFCFAQADTATTSAPVLGRESPSLISPKGKYYLTDVIIEWDWDIAPTTLPTRINVEVLSPERDAGETLVFERTSTNLAWKFSGTIELSDQLTFVSNWDDSGNFGRVHLVRSELEELGNRSGSHSGIRRQFVTETDTAPSTLTFNISIVPPNENPAPQANQVLGQYGDSTLSLLESLDLLDLAIPDDMPASRKAALLNARGYHFWKSFNDTGSDGDINKCILAYVLAVQLAPVNDANLMVFVGNAAVAVRERHALLGKKSDIDGAISMLEVMVHETPDRHEHKPRWLGYLGNSYQCRFEHNGGDMADLNKAILFQQKAIDLAPDDDIALPTILGDLGVSFRHRFEHTGDQTYISKALSYQQTALSLTHGGHVDTPDLLTNLASSYQSRFEFTGDMADSSEAISCQEKALHLSPDDAGHLSELGRLYLRRFDRTGDLTDITESMSAVKKALSLTPENHVYFSGRLNNLGDVYRSRFTRTGDLIDISEAISYFQKAILLTPDGNPKMPLRMSGLASSHTSRFQHTGDLADNSEAISLLKSAVQLIPDGHPQRPVILSNFAISLTHRFNHTRELKDIDEAISLYQTTLTLTRKDHGYLPGYFSGLGDCFLMRFKHKQDLMDISESISAHQKAVKLTPNGHSEMPRFLGNLGLSFHSRFECTGNNADISEAISVVQRAIELTPDGHVQMLNLLDSIGILYEVRFKSTGDVNDIHSAISNNRRAATYSCGSPSTRLKTARRWVVLSMGWDPSQVMDACNVEIHLISQVAGLEQTIRKRYDNLFDISRLSTSVAAAAFNVGRLDLALQWLEQGRCLVWSQLNDLRTPLHALRAIDPAMADEILRVSSALEFAGSQVEVGALSRDVSTVQKFSLQDQATIRVKLAEEWDKLLGKVRAMPEFEDFLQPPSCSKLLKHLPEGGPVILINIQKVRCDALALIAGAEPLHIPLPDFSYAEAERLRTNLQVYLNRAGVRLREDGPATRGMREKGDEGIMKDILGQLWLLVVRPILDALGCPPKGLTSDLQRIWWCATGPLAFLPIHAAGIYDDSTTGAAVHLSDFAISSYTPTVRALSERLTNIRQVDEKAGIFIINQPDTPKQAPIPGTTKEVRAIQRLTTDRKIQVQCLERASATVNRVMTEMENHSCIHFACHASQSTADPLKSGFALHDGRLELSSIIQKRLTGADLAFLSACQTSTGDEKLAEEAVHLAAGMLAAGYRGVVATMWSIRDQYAPGVAEDFYATLIDGAGILSGENAARALHYATQKLRRKAVANEPDLESSLLVWVPYVHFGL